MEQKEKHSIVFEEEQRFSQWVLWLFFALVIGDLVYAYFSDNAAKEDRLVGIVITCLVFCAFLFFKLKTRINAQGIYVQFVPFHRAERFYPWSGIALAEVRSYKPLREYGGWGLRGLGSNRALNVRGKMGIQLVFENGNRLLIGTQKGGQAKEAIDAFFKDMGHQPLG
jgi:hypothetical protein